MTPPARTLHLEHSLPGRARLRVPKPRTEAGVARISNEIEGAAHVRAVDANLRTGSLLLTFDPEDPLDSILADLRDMGYAVALAASRARGTHQAGGSRAAAAVKAAVTGADRELHARTEGHLDLRIAIPALFAALAARQLVRDARSIWNAPWYQLIYWAFDSFEKLNRTEPR